MADSRVARLADPATHGRKDCRRDQYAGALEAAGEVEPVAFDAAVSESHDGLRLDAVAPVDRRRLGVRADRFAFLLPATAHVTLHLGHRS